MKFARILLLLTAFPSACLAFTPLSSSPRATSSALFMSNNDKKEKIGENMRTKLLSETIAPWRALRLFMYGGLGSGAFIGGLVTIGPVAAALSGARTDVDLNTEVSE